MLIKRIWHVLFLCDLKTYFPKKYKNYLHFQEYYLLYNKMFRQHLASVSSNNLLTFLYTISHGNSSPLRKCLYEIAHLLHHWQPRVFWERIQNRRRRYLFWRTWYTQCFVCHYMFITELPQYQPASTSNLFIATDL